MSPQSVPPLSFNFLPELPLLVQPQEGQISSDAGLLPIAQFDRQWNYTARMAQCLNDPAPDPRQQDRKPVTGIERLKEATGGRLPASLVLDLDATDDPAHGQQQLVLFQGYYGQYQYLPLVISEPTSKHVFLFWLPPCAPREHQARS